MNVGQKATFQSIALLCVTCRQLMPSYFHISLLYSVYLLEVQPYSWTHFHRSLIRLRDQHKFQYLDNI